MSVYEKLLDETHQLQNEVARLEQAVADYSYAAKDFARDNERLQKELELTKFVLADANAHAGEFGVDCMRLEKELAELKGRSCQGCLHAPFCGKEMLYDYDYRKAQPVTCCSLWEKADER